MAVEYRLAQSEDFIALLGKLPDWRVKAWTATVDEKPIAIGGVAFHPGGPIGFIEGFHEARRFPLSYTKAVRRFLAEARGQGVGRIIAEASTEVSSAGRWIERLGFEPQEIDGKRVYLWRAT